MTDFDSLLQPATSEQIRALAAARNDDPLPQHLVDLVTLLDIPVLGPAGYAGQPATKEGFALTVEFREYLETHYG